MSYYRSYFEKNNTILKNSRVNTAKNPNTEIIYGSTFSKYIFKVDFTHLIEKLNNGDLVLNNDTKHYLKLTNTIFGNEDFLRQENSKGRSRATSFDLILFKINEFWDEGVGYDFENSLSEFSDNHKTFDQRPSNWFNRTTTTQWSTHGIFDTNPNIITTIHFDNGNEDINADITDYVNEILNGSENYGIGLSFSLPYSNITSGADQSVAFFTKYTQTFFEPFVESVFNDTILDDRHNFYEKTNQNLYLYVRDGNSFIDLDNSPLVDIRDYNNNPIIGLNNLQSIKIRKGVYKVTFGLEGVICDGKRFYHDVWKNLLLDGVQLGDSTQKFVPKPLSQKLKIGSYNSTHEKYAIKFHGIKLNEKIKRGDTRNITINFRSINESNTKPLRNVFYRIYIKEGNTQINVFDWTLVDAINENSFYFDTSYLIPREYYLQIKGNINNEEITYNDEIKFEIISEK